MSCGENFLKLASEIGDYSTQQFRDIEQMRIAADRCNYEKECFKEEVNISIREFCRQGEFDKRGFISKNECERQYPYVFLKIFETGKYTSVEGIQAVEDYREAVRKYEEELQKIEEAEEDLEEAKEEWEEAQRYENEEDYEEVKEDWEEAQRDYDEAWEDYRDEWRDYDKAKREYTSFIHG